MVAKVAITGHRPEKLHNIEWVIEQLRVAYETINPTQIMVGMASGADLIAGTLAISMGIPVIAVKPWAGHVSRIDDWEAYQKVESNAVETVNVNPSMGYPGPAAYYRRNEHMVDHSDIIVAVWDGTKSGTGACVKYAQQQNKPIYRIDPKRQTAGWVNPTETPQGETLF